MNCSKCQAPLPDGARFCEKCGANVAESEQSAPLQQTFVVEGQPSGQSVSVGGWVCRWLINLIPCAGGLVYIIMLFVWAFDTKYDDTSRNWAKAQLIITLIGIVLLAFAVVALFAFGLTNSMVLYDIFGF